MKKNRIGYLLFTLICLLVILFGLGILPNDLACLVYEYRLTTDWDLFFLFILFPFTGFIISLLFGIKKNNRSFFYLLFPIITLTIMGLLERKMEKRDVFSSTGVVYNAKLIDFEISRNSNIIVNYYRKDQLYKSRLLVRGKELKNKMVGDTIQLIFSKDCIYKRVVLNFNPTSVEINKCKDGCYHEDGVLYSKEEYEKLKR
ncbi:MAG: hypothetical protein IPO21_09225 [Bacteroidales bacterium]|nr:hypothetical protein [Bacteroidales bacterium]